MCGLSIFDSSWYSSLTLPLQSDELMSIHIQLTETFISVGNSNINSELQFIVGLWSAYIMF
jgi:hypothetical protein